MATKTRRRTIKSETFSAVTSTYDWNGAVTSSTNHDITISSLQLTTSEGHPWPKGAGVAKLGGPFDTVKTDYTYNSPESYEMRAFLYGAKGRFLGVSSQGDCPNPSWTDAKLLSFVPSLGDTTLRARGSTAISSSAPTKSQADLSVSLAELKREGIPSMLGATLKERSHIAKKAGGEFLNLQFGWLPLISDVRSASQAVLNSYSILKQLERDSGKNVRRGFRFPRTTDVDIKTSSFLQPWELNTYLWKKTAPFSLTTETIRDVWFSGCYTYYYEPTKMAELDRIARQARLLLGIKLTPDVLWNLSPWSWLTDWVFNIGPVIENVSMFSQDGLTLRWGFVMERTQIRRDHIFWGNGVGPKPPRSALQCSVFATRKRRLEVSPYSLGLVGQAFKARQLAILAALGVSR